MILASHFLGIAVQRMRVSNLHLPPSLGTRFDRLSDIVDALAERGEAVFTLTAWHPTAQAFIELSTALCPVMSCAPSHFSTPAAVSSLEWIGLSVRYLFAWSVIVTGVLALRYQAM